MCWPAPARAAQPALSHLPEEPSPDPVHGTKLACLVTSAPWMSLPSPAQRVAQCPGSAGTSSFQTCFPSIHPLEGLHKQSSPEFSPNCFPSHPHSWCALCMRVQLSHQHHSPPASCPPRLLAVATGCSQPSWSGEASLLDVSQVLLLEDLSLSCLGPGFSQAQCSTCCSEEGLVTLSQAPELDAACLTSPCSWQMSWD